MIVGPLEMARRSSSRLTGRLRSLPILALTVHSACNCRCVMCDIWKANAEKRELSPDALARHVDALRRLHVQRVMLTGGEPLLHSNLWALCAELKALGIHVTLLTTGLTLAAHAEPVAAWCDDVVVSVDGPRDVHDAIRRVRGGFERIGAGVAALRARRPGLPIGARSVVQRANCTSVPETIAGARRLGVDWISFLAADASSTAFNRPEPWTPERAREVSLETSDLAPFAEAIERAAGDRAADLESGFVAGGAAGLWRIHRHYAASCGAGEPPAIRCNAPWVSAVVDVDQAVRPCFFHPPYGSIRSASLEDVVNSPGAIAFRRGLDVNRDPTCRRCVCTLQLPAGRRA